MRRMGLLHWIVEGPIQIVLVWANQGWVTVVDLTNTVDASSTLVSGKEGRLDFKDAIDTQSVD